MKRIIVGGLMLFCLGACFSSCGRLFQTCGSFSTPPMVLLITTAEDSVSIFSKQHENYDQLTEVIAVINNDEEPIEWEYNNIEDERVFLSFPKSTFDSKYLDAEIMLILKYERLSIDTIVYKNTIIDECEGFYTVDNDYFIYNGVNYYEDFDRAIEFVLIKKL